MSHFVRPAGFLHLFRIRISLFILLVAGLFLPAAARAQVSFTAAQNLLASGFQSPTGVAVDGSGNVYVADAYAGTVNEIVAVNGAIPAGATVKTLASGLGEPFGIALGSSGDIYVANITGNAIMEIVAVSGSIPASPSVITLATSAAGFSEPFGVAVDASGNVYFTASGSSPFDNGVVMEILAVSGSIPASPTIVTLSNSFRQPAGIAVDASGNVYIGNKGDAFISELVAVSGSIPASPTVNQLGSGLNQPSGVAVDASGNVYVADNTLHSVVEMVAVNGSVPASPTILSLGSVSNPWGVAIDQKGNVYSSDVNNNVVDEVFPSGSFGSVNIGASSSTISALFSFSGSVTLGSKSVVTAGTSGLDFADAGTGTCAASQAYSAGQSCTVDVKFTPVYAGLRRGAIVLKDGSGNILATGYVQGSGTGPQAAFAPALRSSLATGFGFPIAAAADSSGNVYVADAGPGTLYKVAPNGTKTLMATGFGLPVSVAVDGAGNVYVGDESFGSSAVYKITPAGVKTALTTGVTLPQGLAVDGAGNVYVANYQNPPVVYKVAQDGTQTTLSSGYAGPEGVAVDAAGDVFVADQNGGSGVGTLYEITPDGIRHTIDSNLEAPSNVVLDAAGNAYVTDEDRVALIQIAPNGSETTVATGFGNPSGLAVDDLGNLYVVDADNQEVDKFDRVDTPSISFAATTDFTTSTDSPSTVQVENIGNASLTFTALSYPTDFPEGTGDANACTGASVLSATQVCDLPIDFTPQTMGSLSESVSITDNTLNAPGTVQSIGVSGTGQAASTQANHFSVSVAGSVAAGSPFSVTVSALNSSNQVVTGYSGTVHFSSSDLNAALPANTTLSSGTGTYSATLITSGAQSVTATDTVFSAVTGSGATTVNPGTAVTMTLTAAASTNVGASLSFTTTVFDSYNNLATGYTGTVQFTSTDASADLPASTTLSSGTGSFSATMMTVGTQTITATDSTTPSLAGTSGSIVVSIPTLVVTTALDDGGVYTNCTLQTTAGTGTDASCSLRDALAYAQIAGSASITFDSTVFSASNSTVQNTISLGGINPSLGLPSNTTITGPFTGSGATRTNLVTLNGDGTTSDVFVNFGVINTNLNNLNMIGGGGGQGAGINNDGILTVSNSVISGNTISGSGFICGGGIYTSGTLTLNTSTVSGNSVTVTGSGAEGGGICNNGTLNVNNSTISGNTVSAGSGFAFGGGIYEAAGSATINNSTLSGNSTAANGQGSGGGIYTFGSINMTNATISGNSADSGGGLVAGGTVNLSNSIVSGNSAAANADTSTSGGTINSIAGNLIGVSGIGLAPLANHGGATQTMVPEPGSPAICGGVVANDGGLTTDQRGFPLDSSCAAGALDAGAIQAHYALTFSTEPPSSASVGQAISPAPVVQLTESGALATTASGTVSLIDGDSLLTGTTSASLASGAATFSNLTIPTLTASDSLTASMTLSSALGLSLSATSSTFAVVEPPVQVTVGTNPSGLAFSIDGTPFTGAQTPTWTVGDQHTIATTTPQTGSGVSYAFAGWSDSGALSHSVTASSGTTSYTASFTASYQLNIAASNVSFGSVTPASGSYYAPGTVVNISATPATGYYFAGWAGSADIASTSSASTTITMNGAETITANFAAIPNYVVTTAADDAGTASNCTAQAAAGTGTDASCSLRDALMQAATTTAGNVSFDSTVFSASNTSAQNTITLTNSLMTVTGTTTIVGPTSGSGATLANLVTVSGGNTTEILQINSGVASISNLNFSTANGQNGSAINVDAGALTVAGCTFIGNTASQNGGALYNAGTLTVTGSTFTGNTATQQGAGIYNSGTMTVTGSTFSGNTGGFGGGIYSAGNDTVSNSTFTGNAAFNGGGIYAHGVMTLVNATVSGNTATGAGGIYVDNVLNMANSVVAGNSAGTYADVGGTYTDNGGNQASGDPSGTSTIAINLAPLANYGGTIQTMLPLPGSPAICAGTSANATGLSADQRGLAFDSNCASGTVDAGAVQSNYAIAFSTEPPSSAFVSQALTPAPVVQITENGTLSTPATGTVTMTDSATLLGGTASENFASGLATFDTLTIGSVTSGDTLTATLILNGSTSLTATSTAVSAAKATPTITWNAPSAIIYGTALSSTQLNATASAAGTFAYSPDTGAVLGAGSQTLSVTFTPTDTNAYTTATANVQLTVNQATPSITWSTPAAITYGTALDATQLNANSPVAGAFVYSPVSGTVLGAGSQTLSVSFTPTDTTDYTTATANVLLTVNQATPSITWSTPAAITYGTALDATQLNANSPVAGAFVYSPVSGTVLGAGSQTLSVTFTPTDATDYTTATANVLLTVNQATPSITWSTPAAITYGTALDATQLNASSPVAGAFVYSPVSGTVLGAGSQTLSVTLTPTDTTDYTTATANVQLTVNKATPSITWSAPSAIAYGTALSGTQLNASSTVAGGLVYTPAAGAVLGAGSQTLSVSLTPTDTTDYNTASTTVQLTVNQATPSITWSTPAAIPYGTALSVTQLNANSPVAGAFAYSPDLGAVLTAGSHQLSVTFTPTDTTDYTTANANVQLTVNKATPQITWANPAPIPSGTALSGSQLNATANTAGSFVYAPLAGTVLGPGPQSLSAAFTPTDTTDYTTASANVSITIDQQASLTAPTQGSTLPGASVTFSWTAGGGVTAYQLWLGTTGVNSSNVYNSGSISATSVNLTTVPANGVLIYARLWSQINGAWQPADYVFTEGGTPSPAVLSTPTPSTVLPGSSATFSWTAGSGPTQYQLWLSGVGVAQSDLYNSGAVTGTSVSVTGLPTFGVKVYARLWSRINGNWQSRDYTYTEAGSPVLAAIASPTAGTHLSGSSQAFSWSAGGGVTQYELWLGTTGVGSSDVYNSGALSGTSTNVTGIPTNGVALYARLYSRINGLWQFTDYLYTQAGSPVLAAITSPTAGSTFGGSSQNFTWTAGAGPTQYELWLGTTGVGSSNLYNSGQLTTTSVMATGLPTFGVKVYARLYSRISGNWQSVDYTFTEAGTPVLAALSSPTAGSVLGGSSATFTWTTGGGPTEYELWLGTTGIGSSNVFSTNNVTGTSANATNLPTNGVLLYARLWSLVSGVWKSVDYTYTEAGTPSQGALTSPAPGTQLAGSSATFTWTAGAGPTQYQLWLGTTGVGSSDAYNSGSVTATTVNVTNLPTTGAKLYARLYSRINGAWQYTDYVYTEFGTSSPASLITPTAGSQLAGSSVTFTWTTGSGPTAYELWLGTTGINSTNLYNSGSVTSTSVTVTGLPTDGSKIYARLWSRINGVWQPTDYTFTAQ